MEFDSLVVDAPQSGQVNRPAALRSVTAPDKQKANT
jgi:hypothetical protein